MNGRLKPEWVIQRDGKKYVLYSGLLDLAHRQSGGRLRITTTLVQVPTDANGQVAICTAEAAMFEPEGNMYRCCTGIGDASPQNTNRMMATALIRLSETRAKARALRDVTNVGFTALEEVGTEPPEDEDDTASLRAKYARLAAAARKRGLPVVELTAGADAATITQLGRELQAELAALDAAAKRAAGSD